MRALPRSFAISALVYGIALTVAATLFDGFRVEAVWLIVAVIVFMALSVALQRFIVSSFDRYVRSYTIIGGLVLTFVELLLTDLLVPAAGFDIDGGWTWAGVTAIVWAA